ncbi:Acyl-coenzyme A thioesterase 9 [Wickerhamomyces ciferrii]|uniref:Acyl-coenzyme A thioesterase 9 n=1 Tax=Wickerhamomyces ciferrii (strain ATCC 14091 / BCRC 22168 / CBS 111 / JCM 3599 / NBRC 0793 / NRRL Y-1031 F-60-10) TaxID=1206466 RepID=K0KKN3_WICCF|nr:Acyl-coenzyme A thioesterase 9 [Wickerhamomyces ciferrii]CCH43556.1 Acyl-coenzyme A thioesterase 9 [Wickerhamomyces ciferrii]
MLKYSKALRVTGGSLRAACRFQSTKSPANLEAGSNDASAAEDASTTILADKRDASTVISAFEDSSRAATWLTALAERKRQLAQGKVIDSFAYNTPQVPVISDKTRSESFSYLTLNFKEDLWLADFYVNAAGRLRMGQIFQDLDALAGRISYRFVSPAAPIIVTAQVSRIYMLKRINEIADKNFILSGSVVWTGRSSMEILIKASTTNESVKKNLKEEDIKEEDVFLTASFTFVARNPETHKSFPINRLLPISENEWIDYRRAESQNAAKKLAKNKDSLDKQPPTSEESQLIHKMFLASKELAKYNELPKNVSLMKDTKTQSTSFMQPQYRNRHSYMIFGGYLMRQTFELAYCTAASFSSSFPRFVSLDTTTFKAPVPVGSVLFMNSTVVYTEHIHQQEFKPLSKELAEGSFSEESFLHFDARPTNVLSNDPNNFLNSPGTLIQVKVDTSVKALNESKETPSGSFVYSFFVPTEAESDSIKNPGFSSVIPETYSEMIEFIEGRRRAQETARYAQQIQN